ncbi:E3 SUMO-protein ligase NSE2 isoform X3 [Myotis yumanensis]|uniref:E3 SUMO-protein ligase NSE2 isoform X3 n=1 Tax=Myotis yumanensis TaxID=159337 RepID=UPI0038D37432
MPGRSSSNSGSTGFISFSGVESALSSLKNFQNCINTGMDTASSVALDLVETQTEVSSEYSMDKAMVEFAMMDRELNHYVKAVQSTINHVKEERPENIPDLKLLVEKKFLALQNKNSDADFQNNEKFVQFKQQLRELKKQWKPKEDGGHSEVDKIKDKDASRAGNERGYRIFSSILIFLSFLKQLYLKGFQIPHTAAETVKHTFSTTCSTGL